MDENELQKIAADLEKKTEEDRSEIKEKILKLDPPTEEQIEKCEQLLRQLMLARQREQKSIVQKLLEELEGIAPNYAPVQEAIGDDYVERRQFRKAKEAFALAKELDPESATIENKYGEMVLKVDLRIDPAIYQDAGTMATGKGATILSVLLPGLGHFVLGKTITGIVLVGIWIFCWILILLPGGFESVLGTSGLGSSRQPLNVFTALGLIGAIGTYFVSLSMVSTIAKQMVPIKIDRPTPPSNQDFE